MHASFRCESPFATAGGGLGFGRDNSCLIHDLGSITFIWYFVYHFSIEKFYNENEQGTYFYV